MTQLTVLGVSYKTAPLSVREKLTFDLPSILVCSRALVAVGLVRAIAIVSTCHRTEFYCDGLSSARVGEFWAWLQCNRQFPTIETLNASIYRYTDIVMVKHLLRVSAGLDSLVVGETQILGQMKAAYDQAAMAGTLGKNLSRLFQFAFGVAKKIRTETFIGANSRSVACMATRLLERVLPGEAPLTVMFVGSGAMIAIAARHLQRWRRIQPIFINRTSKKVMPLAEKYGGEIYPLSAIGEQLTKVDVVITATASPMPLVAAAAVEAALNRRHRPLLLIDLAVPRDIEPVAGTLPGVYLYTVDDLQAMATDNPQVRHEAAIAAENMVSQKAEQFIRWLWAQSDIEWIRHYRDACATIRDSSLREAVIALKKGSSPEAVMQHLVYRLTNRLIHGPTVALRQAIFSGHLPVALKKEKNNKMIKKSRLSIDENIYT